MEDIRHNAWLEFQSEMQKYVECNKTSLVTSVYVNQLSGYKLGQHLVVVRNGQLWKGDPEEETRVKWLESLPGWTWTPLEDIQNNGWITFKSEMETYVECNKTSLVPDAYVNPVSGHKLGKQLYKVRQGRFWNCHLEKETRIKWLESLPHWAWRVMETQESKNKRFERDNAQLMDAVLEQRAQWLRKTPEERSKSDSNAFLKTTGKRQHKRRWMTKEQLIADLVIKAKDNRSDDRKKARLLAYRNVFGRPKATNKEVLDAVRRGIFYEETNGVWSARVRDQGSSNEAGSSAEHGAHV